MKRVPPDIGFAKLIKFVYLSYLVFLSFCTIFPSCSVAVSYTHLDVYKRQLFPLLGRFPASRLPSQPAPFLAVQLPSAIKAVDDPLVFDEPTASLSDSETKQLFKMISDLKAKGCLLYTSSRSATTYPPGSADLCSIPGNGLKPGVRYWPFVRLSFPQRPPSPLSLIHI